MTSLPSTYRRKRRHQAIAAGLYTSLFFPSSTTLRVAGCSAFSAPAAPSFSASQVHRQDSDHLLEPPDLCGTWSDARLSLRHPKCCVVSVANLTPHIRTLQSSFADADDGRPFDDLDLRMRVRCGRGYRAAYADCEMIRRAVLRPLAGGDVEDVRREYYEDEHKDADERSASASTGATTHALVELCRGLATLADGPLTTNVQDVHLRIVRASSYRARDPMFHTDKCPLRGYVTLTGPGTEYMRRPCSPVEYGMLRSGLGGNDDHGGSTTSSNLRNDLASAGELEFIVMKGDCYDAPLPADVELSLADRLMRGAWRRSSACVHRSPPGGGVGVGSGDNIKTAGQNRHQQRVIVSLDLADGDDDQEWYVSGRRRGWRLGMTQRKSRLVA